MEYLAMLPKSTLDGFFTKASLILLAALVLAILLTVGVKRFSERFENRNNDGEERDYDDTERR